MVFFILALLEESAGDQQDADSAATVVADPLHIH